MKTVKRMCEDIRKYWSYAVWAARAELKSEVANSYLNWVWWVLEPLCMMLIYAFIFGTVFNGGEPYFAIFIFVGLTLWNFFNGCVTSSVKSMKRNKAIISKVYIPKYILILVKMMVMAFKMLISFGIIVLMMIFYRVPVTPLILYMPLILLVLFTFTFALSVHLMHFGVFIEDMGNIVNIVLRLVFYMTGIFYNITKRLPGTIGVVLSNWNPTALVIVSSRRVLLYGQVPSWKYLLLWLVISIVVAIWGVQRIYKYENSYAKIV